jgi:hypothetical protein
VAVGVVESSRTSLAQAAIEARFTLARRGA